jgi:CubicO group peptidase (beta-lactamase class C family)
MTRFWIGALALLTLPFSGGEAQAPAPLYFPPATGAWQTVSPQSAGWDEAKLKAALEFAGRKNSTAVVILYGGKIMAEQYWSGWNGSTAQEVASVQKSFTSFLVGVARSEGKLNLDDPVSKYLGPRWSRCPSTEGQITVRHLVTMTSGLGERLECDAQPGAKWMYNTVAYYRVKDVLEKATGQPISPYLQSKLAGPTGMSNTSWLLGSQVLPSSSALQSSARDMARFGLLVQAKGKWGDQTLLGDQSYLNEALSTSQNLNLSYGYLFWLNGKASYLLPGGQGGGQGSLIPCGPNDLVAAMGKKDRKIYVVPSLNLVVVRHGLTADPVQERESLTSFDNELWAKLMAASPLKQTCNAP